MPRDVFISYSSRDKNAADAVCSVLERHGIRCWIAPRDVMPGTVWSTAIISGIRECNIMVLVFSGAANASPQIEREVERVINKGIPIIPLRIEDVQPQDSLEYFISAAHWLDAFTPPFEDHLNKLVEVIQYILSSKAGGEHAASGDTRMIAQAAVAAADARSGNPAAAAQQQSSLDPHDPDRTSKDRHVVSASRPRMSRILAGAGAALFAIVTIAGGALAYRSYLQRSHDRDVAAWKQAVAGDRIRDYDAYLAAFPAGEHAEDAKSWRSKRVANRLVGTLPGNVTGVSALEFTSDSKAILSNASWANKSAEFVLYDLGGEPLRTYGGADGVRGAPFTPDGKSLVAFGASTELRWWDFVDPSKTWVHHNKAGIEWINSLAFSPDGQSYAIACSDGSIRLRDVNVDRELAVLSGHQDWVWTVAYSPNGRWLLSGSADKTARLWDVAGREQRAILGTYKGTAAVIAFSHDSKTAYVSSWADDSISEWDVESGKLLKTIKPSAGMVSGISVSPDGRFLFSYWRDGAIVATELATNRNVLSFRGPVTDLWSISVAPDERTLVTGGKDPLVHVYDISDL